MFNLWRRSALKVRGLCHLKDVGVEAAGGVRGEAPSREKKY